MSKSRRRPWRLRGLTGLRKLKSRGALTQLPAEQRIIAQKKQRTTDLQYAIRCTPQRASALLSSLHPRFVIDRGLFISYLTTLSREKIKPGELSPEHFTKKGLSELIATCNADPKLRYSTFFRPGVFVRVVVNGTVYGGKVVSNNAGNITVFVKARQAQKSMTQLEKPFTVTLTLNDPNLTRSLTTRSF